MQRNAEPELNRVVRRLIELHAQGVHITLLAVCPNSDAVLEAAVKAAKDYKTPMLFAATLNQVDRDGGYTGWTPHLFVARMRELAAKYGCESPLYPCLDHGGPWLKDTHTRDRLSLEQTMAEVKASLTACLEAGYMLLHVDPTVDRTLPAGQAPPVEAVVQRTVELIAHAEAERKRLGLPSVAYEVGTEEVHGGLVNMEVFDRFLTGLWDGLRAIGLDDVWPCFIVAKVGTDLHTTTFDPVVARQLYNRVVPLGSLIKGHYTDWVINLAEYPKCGIGGANVGPEFTETEVKALEELCERERALLARRPSLQSSGFMEVLRDLALASGRWRKWLTPDETGMDFAELAPERQAWLVMTAARYVWTDPRVMAARERLYENVRAEIANPHGFVVERIEQNIQKYIDAFNLQGSVAQLYPA